MGNTTSMTAASKPRRKLFYGSVATWFVGFILCGAFSQAVPEIPITYLCLWAVFFVGAFVVGEKISKPPPGVVLVVFLAPFLALASTIVYWLNIFR